MNNIPNLNKPTMRDIFYYRQRQKNRVFHSVLAYFVEWARNDSATKKELAELSNSDPSQITRWLSGPGNWTLDTISDLLLAMGAEMKYEITSLNSHEYKPVITIYSETGMKVISSVGNATATGTTPIPSVIHTQPATPVQMAANG